jgi:hypothetical protein
MKCCSCKNKGKIPGDCHNEKKKRLEMRKLELEVDKLNVEIRKLKEE